MKRKHRNNLIRLIFIHLLLLAYPLVSKTFHVHHGDRTFYEFAGATCFGQPENPCPVCDFEFYNFVSANPVNLSFEPHFIRVCNSPAPKIRFISFVQYFSLRAPPVA